MSEKRYNGIETLRRIAAQVTLYNKTEWAGPVIEADEWEGSCICDDPEPTSPDHGHRNEAGGYCCPHHGNTCGYHPEYR